MNGYRIWCFVLLFLAAFVVVDVHAEGTENTNSTEITTVKPQPETENGNSTQTGTVDPQPPEAENRNNTQTETADPQQPEGTENTNSTEITTVKPLQPETENANSTEITTVKILQPATENRNRTQTGTVDSQQPETENRNNTLTETADPQQPEAENTNRTQTGTGDQQKPETENTNTQTKTDDPQKPNIVFILADDLGWDDIGYNNPFVISPTIDGLAREGVILNQSYVQPECTPTRAALLTGYFPYRIGMQHKVFSRNEPTGLPLHLTLLPEELRNHGYATYMVGKWHLGFCKWEYTPLARGFDRFYGFFNGIADHYNHTTNGILDLRDNMNPDRTQTGVYSGDLFGGKAADFITYHDQRKPFFLYLSLQSVHSPLQAPQKYIDMYASIKDRHRRKKLAMVTAMDDSVKMVVSALKDAGMENNTLIVFSSDNGGTAQVNNAGSNWPLRGAKKTLWEGGTRCVGFVHGKMLERTGYINNEMIHAVDWYPTLLGLAGGKTDGDIDGIDVWDMLSKGDRSPRTEFVYNIDKIGPASAAIRVGDYKLIVGKAGNPASWNAPPEREDVESELRRPKKRGRRRFNITGRHTRDKESKRYLFNIRDDPTERTNLVFDMPRKADMMQRHLDRLARGLVPTVRTSPTVSKANPHKFNDVWSPGWCYCNE